MRLRQHKCKRRSRRGFSLMEVILATAILMGSVVVLARLISMGRTQANRATDHTEAQQVCEATLNEVILGIRPTDTVENEPLKPAEESIGMGGLAEREAELQADEQLFGASDDSDETFEEMPEWNYSVRYEPMTEMPGLAQLTVEVVQAESELSRPLRYQLTRWIRTGKPVDAMGESE